MMWMIHLLYNLLAVPLLASAYGVLILVNTKVRERFRMVRRSHEALPASSSAVPTLWFHAASMGEFEQAKPVIERLKDRYKNVRIIVSFSSPSGYRSQHSYPFADAVIYLPFDATWSMRKLVRRVSPDVFVCLRYDLWWNLAWHLRRNGTPILLLNATSTRSSALRRFPGRSFMTHLLDMCSTIVTANEVETERFRAFGLTSEIITGSDTRYDRIRSAVASAAPHEGWFHGADNDESLVLVAGSVWQEDAVRCGIDGSIAERHPHLRLIIVPHEVDERSLREWEERIRGIVRVSTVRTSTADIAPRHILVDTMGELLSFYRYAHVAYVGGGFGSGVHSVAEPAAYGVPVACGPLTRNSPDVERLRSVNGCEIVASVHDFDAWIQVMTDEENRRRVGAANAAVIAAAAGATKSAVAMIERYLP